MWYKTVLSQVPLIVVIIVFTVIACVYVSNTQEGCCRDEFVWPTDNFTIE